MKKSASFVTIILSLIVMALWGSLFPFIKIGYTAFGIDTACVPDILMFAGLRFTVCGIIITAISFFRGERMDLSVKYSIIPVLVTGLFAVVLHYAFTYIGLALTESSKTAILKQLGALIYICFAFLVVKEEKFSLFKIMGALLGFSGIIAINSTADGFSMGMGDILIILASVCTVISNLYGKQALSHNSSFVVTGVSQLFGGLVLLCSAFASGGQLPQFTFNALPVFMYICTASMIAYCLWYYIINNNNLSNMFIIKFSEPVFASVFGALLLGENIFKLSYLIAFVLISGGILLANCNIKKG